MTPKAVAAVLGMTVLALSTASARADAGAGEETFKAAGCLECHYTDGPAREQTIDDQLAKKGPELWYAGSKFQKDWLQAWLAQPQPIRPMKFNSLTEKNPGDHQALSGEDVANVTDFLMGLTSSDVEAGAIEPKNNPKGRLIFTKKMPCSGCHQFEDKKGLAGGLMGPTLVGAGKRLNPDWIYAYLLKPKVFKPVKMMPVFVDILRDKDMQDVAAYVASFE